MDDAGLYSIAEAQLRLIDELKSGFRLHPL
jgi:hypothetical protein